MSFTTWFAAASREIANETPNETPRSARGVFDSRNTKEASLNAMMVSGRAETGLNAARPGDSLLRSRSRRQGQRQDPRHEIPLSSLEQEPQTA